MESPQSHTSSFLRDRMAEYLREQARLCERIANECWSEKIAGKFKRLAQECDEAAVMKEPQSVITRAAWPTPGRSGGMISKPSD
jgi:hypothetical protein